MNSTTKTRRFCFVSTMNGVAWGGSERLWSETALRLRQAGHHVQVSVLRWPQRPPPLVELGARGGAISYRSRRDGVLGRAIHRGFRRLFPGPLAISQRLWLQGATPDLVVISQGGPWDGVPWMLACRRLGLPYCTVVNANSEIWWPNDSDLESIRTAFGGARRVFFASHANHELMERQCGMRFTNAEIVVNPIKVPLDAETAWPADDGRFHLASVARLEPRAKGQDLLLGVLAQPKWRDRAVHLNVYGSGPAEKGLKSLSEFLGLDNVTFRGVVDDMGALWRENHALIVSSRYEGLPLVLVEAMICARVVIATDVAGCGELVRDNVSGFLASAPTIPLLDEAMERAWDHRARWRGIGRQARADALRMQPADPVGDFAARLSSLDAETVRR